MKEIRRTLMISLVSLCLVILGLVSSCRKPPTDPAEMARMVDDGSWYSRVQWPHDGNPYTSQNFVVYSDAASHEARKAVAEVGEDVLAELVAEFSIDASKAFHFPAGQSKIHIYAYKNRFPQTWGARAYYAGFVIWSLDHEHRPLDLDSYRKTARHELVHVVEALLKGRDVIYVALDSRVHVWFSEGFGEVITGGTTGKSISDLGYFNYLTDKYGMICPVSIIHDGMAGDWSTEEAAAESSAAGSEYYYPMYHLAIEYLTDPDGHGRTTQDAISVFEDIGTGLDFKTAFENRMGISVEEFEAQFFDLMNDYLDEGGSLIVKRVSIAWLFLMTVSLVVCSWLVFRDASIRFGEKLSWLMATALFGPVSILIYKLVSNPGEQPAANWRVAVKSSVITASFNVFAFMLISAAVITSLGRAARLVPENFLVLFILAWLIGYAVFALARKRGWYESARRWTFLSELISMILAIAGLFIAFTPFSAYWWGVFDPRSIYFWGLIPIAAMIGTILVYPYRALLISRGSVLSLDEQQPAVSQ